MDMEKKEKKDRLEGDIYIAATDYNALLTQ